MLEKKRVKPKSELRWIVVLVESGIPVMVEAYRSKRSVMKREQSLRESIRPDYDEVGIFQIKI